MKKLLLLLTLTFAASSFATSPTKRKPAQVDSKSKLAAVFQQYLACQSGETRKIEPIKLCVSQVVAPKTQQGRIDRLATWLLLSPEVTLIRDCTPDELKKSAYFPERTAEALCFDFKLGPRPDRGVVYFNTVEGRSYLYSFDY